MRLVSGALRVLLVLVVGGATSAYVVLYVVSGDLAATYPTQAHLRLPLYGEALVAGVPVAVALAGLWRFASSVARGEAFSGRTASLLRLLRNSFAALAVYLLGAFVATSAALAPDSSPTVFLAWVGGEVLAVLLAVVAALSVRRVDDGARMRVENDLTV